MFSLFEKNSSPVEKKNQRLLGSMENAFMKASQKYQGFMRICEVLHLKGPYISIETLSKAVGKLQQRHPTLRSRLQRNSQKAHSYLLEEDKTLQLKIIEISRKRSDHQTFWKQEWRKREKSTTAIGEGLAEFWLLQVKSFDIKYYSRFIIHRIQKIKMMIIVHEKLYLFVNIVFLMHYH